MKNKVNIIEFSKWKTKDKITNPSDDYLHFEETEYYSELIGNEDYPELVRYCERIAKRRPDDLNAQYRLGDAYFLNGEYDKAIEFMTCHHRKHPWDLDYQYVILDSLFALGKTESDFEWIENPKILRMSASIVDACYEFMKHKRNPRSVLELYTNFVSDGYICFSEDDLLEALLNDNRFKVDKPENELFADVSVIRKK